MLFNRELVNNSPAVENNSSELSNVAKTVCDYLQGILRVIAY
jgi:hypothetical protein